MELNTYRKHVKELAERRDGTPVFNGSTEHAAVITESMFAKAAKQVSILSGKMNARVYGPEEVREQIELFLADDSHKLRVLLEDASEANLKDHPFFDRFLGRDNVEVRGLAEEVSKTYPWHFLVMDTDCYRFESDKAKHQAVAVFGEPKGATNLLAVFDDLWKSAEPVEKPQ